MKLTIKFDVLKNNSPIDVFEGKSKKTGNDFKMVSQEVYADMGGPFPEKMIINIPDENSKLLEGKYYGDWDIKLNDRSKPEIYDRNVFSTIKLQK